MWLLADALADYAPECEIHDGSPRIEGARLALHSLPNAADPRYVYLYEQSGVITLISGPDRVSLPGAQEVSCVMNKLLSVFERYNTWEKELAECAAQGDIQKIIDCGTAVLQNPIVLGSNSGGILAMSSKFEDQDLNSYWIEARRTRRIPISILTAPKYTEGGDLTFWSSEPEHIRILDGVKTVSSYLTRHGKRLAGISVWQYLHPITQGDTYLMQCLCDALIPVLAEQADVESSISLSLIVRDLIQGASVDTPLLEAIENFCPKPWYLLFIESLHNREPGLWDSVGHTLQNIDPSCLIYNTGTELAVLVSVSRASRLLNACIGSPVEAYLKICVSLPFFDLSRLHVRFEQQRFGSRQIGQQAGIFHAEDYIHNYILDILIHLNEKEDLPHPILARLKNYDRQKNTDLYLTLYEFLKAERSVQRCSKALHIHKNTLLYRLERIHDLTHADLDNPELRLYLLLSFLMEQLAGNTGEKASTPPKQKE